MGFGHRVYRAEDPRSRILKETARELGSPQIEIAEQLEQAALDGARAAPARAAAEDERRVLLGARARRRRDPAAARARDVRLLARGRLVGAHPRAEAHRAAVPALGALRRPGTRTAPARLVTTLAEAAAQADDLAKQGRRARAGGPARQVGRRDRGGRAQQRLPRAGRRLPGGRAVPVPSEDRAPAAGLEDESPAAAARR